MPDSVINLYSDTQTQPSDAMRQAMAYAEVGDEQRGLDPTVNSLQEEVAELLGMEEAVFLPSGSMCNQIAVRLHIRPLGDEMYLHRLAHPITAEAGGAATISGAMIMPLEGEGGMFDGETRCPVRSSTKFMKLPHHRLARPVGLPPIQRRASATTPPPPDERPAVEDPPFATEANESAAAASIRRWRDVARCGSAIGPKEKPAGAKAPEPSTECRSDAAGFIWRATRS